RYQVKREFARGGMGLIWVALDSAVGREVALKELLPPKLGSGTSRVTDSPELVERFLREAKVTGQLEHPNIVPVYEIATREDGSVFYTMKLVR
ncbi:MAG: serine/threonine protein kinase, partial [Planctomycetes bacterium]|nr:serine/threonine protein kinase [Planctomycetota bacterium]